MAVVPVRVAVVVGATGLVGQEVLAALLTADKRATARVLATDMAGTGMHGNPVAVHVLFGQGRRRPLSEAPGVVWHAVDFSALPALPSVNDVYITLGTTQKTAGSREAFRAVDHGAVLAAAKAARAAGATRCGVVTAMGADPQSRIFYNRVKGEVERDLRALGFERLVIARPSLLIGDRAALQQAPRTAESLSLKMARWLHPILPARYRARPGADVAQALVCAMQSGEPGVHILEGHALDPAA